MLREMSARDFQEWSIYSELEPFAPERMDQNFGSVVQAINNGNRNRKLRPKPFTLPECTLSFGDTPATIVAKPQADWRVMKQAAMMMTAASIHDAKGYKGRRLEAGRLNVG